MARNYSSVVEPKTLTGTVSSAATQITLNNVTGLPSPPYILVINPDTAKEEAVLVTVDQTGVTSPTLKVTRAVEASGGAGTAQDHTIGDTVKHMIVGSDLQIVHDHFSDNSLTTGTAHGVSGGVVGRTSSQTITNKTINLSDNTLTGTTAQFNTALSDADFATTALLEARVPVGAVNMWVTGTAPTGWLLCQGQAVSRSTYSGLFAVLGTTYGAGDSSTTFNLPDLRGRTPMGAGTGRNVADSADLTARTLGAKISDAETVTLTAAQSGVPLHSHANTASFSGTAATTGDDSPDHQHGLPFIPASNEASAKILAGASGTSGIFLNRPVVTGGGSGTDGANARHTHSFTPSGSVSVTNVNNTAADAASAHTNVQPSTVINFIIKH
jgi:microcystin-dependent protein